MAVTGDKVFRMKDLMLQDDTHKELLETEWATVGSC